MGALNSRLVELFESAIADLPDDLKSEPALTSAIRSGVLDDVVVAVRTLLREEIESIREWQAQPGTKAMQGLSRHLQGSGSDRRWDALPPQRQARVETYESEHARREGRIARLRRVLFELEMLPFRYDED